MKPTVLLIAYYFPPDNAIGGARPFRFYKYLRRLGYECHVFTAADPKGTRRAMDVHYIPDPLAIRPRQGLAWQAERVSWKFLLRGMQVLGWSDAVFKAGREWMAQHKGERVILLSSSPPIGTHLAAWRLAQKFRSHWIADFRDPIHSPGGTEERAPLEPLVEPRLERSIFKRASIILANTDSMQQTWFARYPAMKAKIHAMWNGFDPEDVISPGLLPARERKVWSHVGELYAGRDLSPLIYAVKRLMDNGRLIDLKIRQIGPSVPQGLPVKDFLEQAQKEQWLELIAPVSAAEARSFALDSDGLLLFQPQSAVQVPGKLFEYLRLGRPILAYVVRNSPVDRILNQARVPYECVYPPGSPQEWEDRILAFRAKMDPRPFPPSNWFNSTFEASRQVSRLHELILSLGESDER